MAARLDDRFDENPKIAGLSDSGVALYVAGICYCHRNLTDGFIPRAVAHRLRYCGGDASPVISELVAANLWEPDGNGWRVHDYLSYQESRADVEAERERARTGMQRTRARRKQDAVTRNGTVTPVTVLRPCYDDPESVDPRSVDPEREGESVTQTLHRNDGLTAPTPQLQYPTEQSVAKLFDLHGRPELAPVYYTTRASVGWVKANGLAVADLDADIKGWIRREDARIQDGNSPKPYVRTADRPENRSAMKAPRIVPND